MILLTSMTALAYDAGDWKCGWKYTSAWTKGINYHWDYDRAWDRAFKSCKRYGNDDAYCVEAIVCRRVTQKEAKDQ